MERGLQMLDLYAHFCRATGIGDVRPVATSAIRDAANRDEFLRAARERSRLAVEVLSTEAEAWYGYLAIANTTTLADGYGIDIGGGSVQVMRIEGRRLAGAGSWPLGAVRMSERFLPGDEAGEKGVKALRKHVRRTVGEADWFGRSNGARLVGIGGTIRNVAAAAERRAGVDHPDVQGYVVTREALADLIDELAGMPARKRGAVPGIKPDRGDVILGGAAVLAAVRGVADRAGGDGGHVVDAGRAAERGEHAGRPHRALDALGLEQLLVAHALADAHRLADLVDVLPVAARLVAEDHEAERVRPHVDDRRATHRRGQ